MTSQLTGQTSGSLLERLRRDPGDQVAWGEFVRRYGPQVYRWCRQWRLQQADAEDVTQTVLVRLAERMRSFTYDPARSFRAYLKTITNYAWCDLLASRRQPGAGSGDSQVFEALQQVEARDDLVQHLNALFDQELLEQATLRVRQRVEAFRLTAWEGLAGAVVADRLGMKVATVFKAKSKVQQMLQEEIAALDGENKPCGV
jgi:RNA polymerase sigma factor (sigma-70 family)